MDELCDFQRLKIKQLKKEVTYILSQLLNSCQEDSGTEAKAAMLDLENTMTVSEQQTDAWRMGKRWLVKALGGAFIQ